MYFLVTGGRDRWSILWTVVCKDALVLASLKLVLFVQFVIFLSRGKESTDDAQGGARILTMLRTSTDLT